MKRIEYHYIIKDSSLSVVFSFLNRFRRNSAPRFCSLLRVLSVILTGLSSLVLELYTFFRFQYHSNRFSRNLAPMICFHPRVFCENLRGLSFEVLELYTFSVFNIMAASSPATANVADVHICECHRWASVADVPMSRLPNVANAHHYIMISLSKTLSLYNKTQFSVRPSVRRIFISQPISTKFGTENLLPPTSAFCGFEGSIIQSSRVIHIFRFQYYGGIKPCDSKCGGCANMRMSQMSQCCECANVANVHHYTINFAI